MWRSAFTTEMVRAWFIEAGQGHRVKPPELNECQGLANYLGNRRLWGPPPNLTDILGDIRKYGRLFLIHLDKSHDRIPKILHPAQQDLAPRLLERIDQTRDEVRESIEALLDDFPVGTLGGDWSWEVWALEIRDLAVAAWSTSNNKPPVATAAEQPLSKFVMKALHEIGQEMAAESVSKALRKTTKT